MTDFAFEEISEADVLAELNAPSRGRAKKPKFDITNRTVTGWFKLPHVQRFCTVPMHDEIQQSLSTEEKEFRQKYPTRMTYHIEPYDVCRDCFLVEADIECQANGLPPVEFE